MATVAMPPAPAVGPTSTFPPEGVPYRLTAEDYERLIETGIIPADRRVGLWEGMLYEKMGKNHPHAVSTSKLNTVMHRVIPPGWCVWPENPITIATDKVPLPDLAIVRGEADDYRARRPGAGDVGLVIEIADTSLKKDTTRALEGYARALVPAYWVVNLVEGRVEVYSRPATKDGVAGYESAEVFGREATVPLVLDGREVARIAVRDILPAEEVPHSP